MHHSSGARPPSRPVTHWISRKTRVLTWGNILFQCLFPLSVSFTPVIAGAPVSSPALQMNSTTYILTRGETVVTVAKKYGLSVDELKAINTDRPLTKPFASLTTGDEISVPRKRPAFTAESAPTPATDPQLSSHLVTGATALASNNAAKSARQLARAAASNEANDAMQRWLNQFGTARVQLNVNDDFTLEGSAIDVLVPFYEDEKNQLFTQVGARHKDSRNTVNIGAGVRTFQNNWMYGANTFFDNDITGKNRRVGVGGEAWTDYLKLSANGYFGLTRWHQSRDFADYNERPANGYDVRAEAYLPTYPQLGGKLVYEQYRGNEVALFGKDNRQKNPNAVTAGLEYTPIPLVTAGVAYRAGKAGQSDSSLNLQFNYRMGASWASQVNSSAVAGSRTLAGSRYDLVERNNNIVLDYQKQELIKLTLPEQVTGKAGETTTLTAQVTSKYGIGRVSWESAGLIAAGGVATETTKTTLTLTYPPYQAVRDTGSNTYNMSVVAYDPRGNKASANVRVQVEPAGASQLTSDLTVTTDNAKANGLDSNGVQAIVKDGNGSLLSGQSVTFTADNGATVTTVIGSTGADGIATATLTNTRAGTTTVMATLSNSEFTTIDTTFIAEPVISGILVNGYTFAATEGFPTTGFTAATFQLLINGEPPVSGAYKWTSNQPWLSVSNTGLVTLSGQPNSGSKSVAVRGVSTTGSTVLTYKFTLSKWFNNNGPNLLKSWIKVSNWCVNKGFILPAKTDLSSQPSGSTSRVIGSLYSEWGSLFAYSGSGFVSVTNFDSYITSELYSVSNFGTTFYKYVNLSTNISGIINADNYLRVVCIKRL